MIRKLAILSGSLILVMAGLFAASSRSLSELTGYFRATADNTVDNLTDKVPDPIRDRKMENELHVARQQLIDRQVELNLSQTQVEQLNKEVRDLAASVERRKRLLAEAYPVLKRAIDQQESAIRFASTDFSLPAFQQEVDSLLDQQRRETRQLEIKREGLQRLEQSLADGKRALTDMRSALENTDQELAVLKSRREQAQIEASTLDLISSATSNQKNVATNVAQGVDHLKQEVRELEARNNARRTLTPGEAGLQNRLAGAWTRLEELKAFHDQLADQPAAEKPAAEKEPAPVVQAEDSAKAPGKKASGKKK